MTLDELLALLPDNTAGEISAADMRAIVTEIYDAGATLEARVQALELAGLVALSITGIWQVNPTAGATPGGAQQTCDTGVLDTAGWLRFTPIDKQDVDLTQALVSCSTIYAQQRQSAARWVTYTVDAVADQGAYIEVTVTVTDSAGTPGAAGWQDGIFVLGGISA